MTVRSRDKMWAFRKPFSLKGVDHALPAGNYRVTTDEELIESLSFPAYRRIATMIFVPGEGQQGSVEMFTIEPADLQAAHERDIGG
jgi:hypothetical protein